MKIYISADMEGTTGVTSFDEVDPNNKIYSNWCDEFTKDVQETVNGLQGEIVVCDGHEDGANLTSINGATLIQGTGEWSMMNNIDQGFDCALFVGYHARAGSEGCLAHTYYFAVKNVFFDGKPVGEFEINATLASYYNVKIAMVSGCEVFIKQAKEYCPWVLVADTKNGGRKNLSKTAKESLKNAKTAPIPQSVEIEFYKGGHYTCEGANYKEKFCNMLKLMEKFR